MKKRLLIVGNGSTSVDKDSNHLINKHTGDFLIVLHKELNVSFFQYSIPHTNDNDLSSFNLNNSGVNFIEAKGKSKFSLLYQIISLVIQFDFIYIFFPGTLSRITGLVCILFRKKFGIYLRGEKIKEYFFDTILIKRAKFVLTVSPYFQEQLKEFNGNIDVIRPMISIGQSDFKLDRNYAIPKVWNLLFVGRVEERKGIYELVEIARYLKNAGYEFVLNIVGGGNLFKEINNLGTQLDLKNKIVLHGLVSDKDHLKTMYDDADAFIFTSHDEGFPRVLYEAMASGLPIFTTFVGGISGRMIHLDNSIEIPVKNPKEAGSIIAKYLKDRDVLEKIGRKGQNTLGEVIDGALFSHDILFLKNIKNEI